MDKNEKLLHKLTPEDQEFTRETTHAVLNKSSPFSRWILYAVILLVLVLLLWAYVGKIEQVTVGEGTVIPTSKVKIIQSLDGGIVVDIPVREGQVVKSGQLLIRLDDTRYTADYRESYAQYMALEAIVARLTAEAYRYPKITFSADLLKNQPELAERETRLFQFRAQALQQEVDVLKNSERLATEEFNMYGALVDKGTVSRVDFLRAQRRVDELKTALLEKIDKFHENVWTELNDKKASLSTLHEKLASLEDKMQRTSIYSPVNGAVKKLNIVTVGGTIQPGMSIMEIVPLEDRLMVQAKIKPADIAFIQVGQQATVRLAAYDYTVYGDLNGKVEYISADTVQQPKEGPTEEPPVYLVNIRTDRNYLGNEKHKLPIIPGMTATVHIITGSRTVLEYIMKPLIKAKKEALRER